MNASIERLFRAPTSMPNGLQATDKGLWTVDQISDRVALVEMEQSSGQSSYGITRMRREVDTESSNTSGLAYGDTAIVTNGKYPFQARNFGALGLSSWFDAVVVSEAVGIRKPELAIFQAACERLDVQPSEAVFVGDNPVADIQGAKSVGMYTIYVPGLFGETCEDADAVLRDYTELTDMVQAAAESRRRQ